MKERRVRPLVRKGQSELNRSTQIHEERRRERKAEKGPAVRRAVSEFFEDYEGDVWK